jgi:peptide/nickel transport system substrate-binding protein
MPGSNFTRRGAAVLVLVLAIAGPAGCKSADKKAARDEGAAKTIDGTAQQRGGMVRIPSNEPRYLNPILEARFVVANALIFEGLVGLDAKLQPVPRLARSWTISKDGKTLTFQLRDDVTWHDGVAFTAADVALTYEAIRTAGAATSWGAYFAPVASLSTPDEHTVVVEYVAPFAPALASWTVGILPRHRYADEADLARAPANLEPVGTGPFRYSRWELGRRLLLEANPAWWQKGPHLDSLELVFGIPEGDALEALREGRIDWTRVGDIEAWLSVAQDAGFLERFHASEVAEPRIRLIGWNTRRPPLRDARVRKALTYALDRSRVMSDVLFGQAQAISAPLFPTMFGYDPSVAPLPFDLEAARSLLDEAAPVKAGKRFALELIVVDSMRGQATEGMVAIFAHDLAELGIELKLTVLHPRDYYDRIGRRDYDAVYFGWLPDIPDPDPAALLHSTQAEAGANYAAFEHPEVDRLVEEARTTVDRAARKKLYEQLQRLLIDEMPYTPLFAPLGHYAWSRRLNGVTPRDVAPQAPSPGAAAWWVDRR